MYCSRCGGQLAPHSAFCRACGAPVSLVVGGPGRPIRPGFITVLGILEIIGAVVWLTAAITMTAEDIGCSQSQSDAGTVGVALLLGALGAAQLLCGVGLLRLRPYGRTMQLVLAWIGLVGIPFGTIIAILILVYMHKPGIKALFSGKELSEFSTDEWAQIAVVTRRSAGATVLAVAIVVLLFAMALLIVVPGALRVRMPGNEATAIGSLRAINSAQAAYSSSCAQGFYAIDLADLVKPPPGGQGFISPDLNTNGVHKSGYIVTLAKDAAAGVTDIGRAAVVCNGPASTPASSYFASAAPVTLPGTLFRCLANRGTGTRYFSTDARGIIFQSTTPIANPIVKSTTVVPLQ